MTGSNPDAGPPRREAAASQVSTAPLRFDADNTFAITQFTDLHYGNGDGPDVPTGRLMGELLDARRPDLVILTGDVIEGSACRDPLRSYADAVRPIVDRGLPWAAVFGNHDAEGSATRQQLMAAMRELPGCLASPGPADLSGVGNYALTVDGPDGPAAQLFFLDSHAFADADRTAYDWVRPDQIDWFRRSAHDLPALMFLHIPLPEFDAVWDGGRCVGSKHEAVCCPRINSGLFDAVRAAGDVAGILVGHDHVNDYAGELHDVRLLYGRATGFRSYGKSGFPRGARIIRLLAGRRAFQTEVLTAP